MQFPTNEKLNIKKIMCRGRINIHNTCSRQEKAASRYFLTFFEHAEDTALKMTFEVVGSSADIALWQDLHRAPIAYKIASFPCHPLIIII